MGYMASGKSTVGRELASKLKYEFLDLDDYIESKEKMTVSSIFNTKGEIYFRKLETIYLKQLLDNSKNTVLALGGGTPCYGNNMQIIIEDDTATSYYLKCSIKTITNRLMAEKSKRPLVTHLNSEEDITEFVGKHLFERNNYYALASKTIVIDNKLINEIVEEILLDLF